MPLQCSSFTKCVRLWARGFRFSAFSPTATTACCCHLVVAANANTKTTASTATHPITDPSVLALQVSQPFAAHFIGPDAASDPSTIAGRFVLPLGDTHPTSVNYTQIAEAAAALGLPGANKYY